MIGEQQHQLRVHLMTLFERELAVRVDKRLVEFICVAEIGLDIELSRTYLVFPQARATAASTASSS